MGSLWEPYGKGVPFLGAPGNSLDLMVVGFMVMNQMGIQSIKNIPSTNPGIHGLFRLPSLKLT